MTFKLNKYFDDKKINKICKLYGLKIVTYEKLNGHHDSYRITDDDSKIYYLKEIPRVDIVNKQEQISYELKKYNIKTYTIIKTIYGEKIIQYLNKKYILINNVEGTKITNKDLADNKILKECARLLAALHLALKKVNINKIKELSTNEIIKIYIHKNQRFINENKFDSIIKIVEKELIKYSKKKSLNNQLIHGDFHTGNLLFNNERANVILDFDLALKGNVYFDIAYFLQRIVKDKEKIALFLSEYKHNNSSLTEEKEMIYLYLLETELIVMNYFLGSARENLALECINDIKHILENKEYYKNLL